jgi:hypothetical protein
MQKPSALLVNLTVAKTATLHHQDKSSVPNLREYVRREDVKLVFTLQRVPLRVVHIVKTRNALLTTGNALTDA